VRIREYAGPLGVLAAAVISFGLLCSASALAMNDLNSLERGAMKPLNIVDLALKNMNTSAALTQQAVTAFVPTQTVTATNTVFPTPLPSNTATLLPSATPHQATPTRRPRTISSDIPLLPPHTKTPLPTATLPPPTDTEIPATETPLPPPTNTESPPTDTPLPPATDTELPPTEPPTQSPIITAP
jgi:hypothetical protein